MLKNAKHFLYVEKYRPSIINDVVLPVRYKKIFQDIIAEGSTQHLLLAGGAGIGKTTIAKALCNELNVDMLIINASENGNIDTLRTTIRDFASSISLTGKGKVVVLDEADYLNKVSTQPALRGLMEEFSQNCRFILTANYINRIIEPLRSRCSVIEFNYNRKELAEVKLSFIKRVRDILNEEKVNYDLKVVAELIKTFLPDMRRVLNELQSNILGNKLDDDIISTAISTDIELVGNWIKDKEFSKMRVWCAENNDVNLTDLFHALFEYFRKIMTDESLPNSVLIMNKYDYQQSFCNDKELNMTAALTELMMDSQFK
jgi:DNA polymerase III delta prime subunit